MASHKRLAALASTTSLVAAYTVDTDQLAVIDQIFISNYSGSAVTFRLAILDPSEAVGAVDQADYLHYDTPLPASSLYSVEIGEKGLKLPAGYSIAIRGSDTNVNIQIFGSVGRNV